MPARTYDLHGLLGLEIHGETVEAAEWALTLAELETESAATVPDVRWFPDLASARPPPEAVAIYAASDGRRPDSYLAVEGGTWDCYGPAPRLLAVFQELLLGRGVSLAHACGLDWDGHGVILCGRGGVGKSSVAFAAFGDPRLRLLSDDVVLMREDGRLLSFPAPLSVYPYHYALLPSALRRELRGRKAQSGVLGPLGRLPVSGSLGRAARRRLIAHGGRLGAAAAAVRGGHQRIHARELFPADRLVGSVAVEVALYLTRGTDWRVDELEPAEARSLLLATTYEELRLDAALAAYAVSGAVDLPRHWQLASEVTERFLGSARRPARIAVPRDAPPHEVQDFVLRAIEERVG